MYKVYLSFGANLGDTVKTISSAIELLCNEKEIELIKQSSFWYTEPMGEKEEIVNQNWYTNCVALFKTNLVVEKLFEKIVDFELKLGRIREENKRNQSRTIDIDILDFNKKRLNTKDLILPHERMFKRAFVLIPLKEIEEEYTFENISIDEYLQKIKYTLDGKKIFQKI